MILIEHKNGQTHLAFISGVGSVACTGYLPIPTCKVRGVYLMGYLLVVLFLFCTASCPSPTLSHKTRPELTSVEYERRSMLKQVPGLVEDQIGLYGQDGPSPAWIVILAASVPCRMVRVCCPYNLQQTRNSLAFLAKQIPGTILAMM